jgi:hypothetical protein
MFLFIKNTMSQTYKLHYYVTSVLGILLHRMLKLFPIYRRTCSRPLQGDYAITTYACKLEQLQLWISSEIRNYTSYIGLSTKTTVTLLYTQLDPNYLYTTQPIPFYYNKRSGKNLHSYLLSFKRLSLR